MLARLGTLLLEAGRQLPGRLDPASGKVEPGDLDDPRMDDGLDDLADLVADMGGEVVVIPADGMEAKTGLAAVYRY